MLKTANTFNQDLSNWAVHNVVNYSGFTTSGSAMAENNYPNFGQEVSYTVRDIGPAGGYVFYDDEIGYDLNGNGTIDDDEKNLLGEGKRYLEAAPAGWSVWSEDRYYVFGFYRTSVSGPNQKVDTGTEIGTGKANTQKLVNAMGSGAYSSISGSETTAQYAARLCTNYRGGGNADWFLPSKDELNLMYENLKRNNLGGFENLNYWSSSEIEWGGQHYGWFQNFNDGGQNDIYRYVELRVRPVRAF